MTSPLSRCTVCSHPDRQAIDALIAEDRVSERTLAHQYGVSRDAINRHKQHVSDKLATIFEEERRDEFAFAVETFIKALHCLRLSLDAHDEWHRDPDCPERYTLDPRDTEVTVVYQEQERAAMVPVRKRANLRDLLQRTNKDWLNVTIKTADPRRLLVDVSNAIDSKLQRFMEAWDRKQEQERRDKEATAAQEDAGAILEEIVIRKLAGPLGEATARKILDLLLAEEE